MKHQKGYARICLVLIIVIHFLTLFSFLGAIASLNSKRSRIVCASSTHSSRNGAVLVLVASIFLTDLMKVTCEFHYVSFVCSWMRPQSMFHLMHYGTWLVNVTMVEEWPMSGIDGFSTQFWLDSISQQSFVMVCWCIAFLLFLIFPVFSTLSFSMKASLSVIRALSWLLLMDLIQAIWMRFAAFRLTFPLKCLDCTTMQRSPKTWMKHRFCWIRSCSLNPKRLALEVC